MRGKCLSPCVPSSFMELVFCTHLCDGHEDVSLRGLTEGHSLINDSSCHALKSIATLPWPGFRMLLLSIYCATRTSSSGAPGGPTSPCMGSLGSRALQQHCWTSTPTALLDFHSNSIAGLPLQQHCWASTPTALLGFHSNSIAGLPPRLSSFLLSFTQGQTPTTLPALSSFSLCLFL